MPLGRRSRRQTRSRGRTAVPAPAAAGSSTTAGTDGRSPRSLAHRSPFAIGFFGAVGALVAIWLGQLILSVSSILVLIVVAMFLAAGLDPMVEFLRRRGLSRAVGVVAVIVAVLAAITLFAFAIAPVVSEQITTLTQRAPAWLDQLQNNPTVERLEQRYNIVGRVRDYISQGDWASQVFGGVVGIGAAVLSAIGNAFVVIVLTLYFLASLPRFKNGLYHFAPASRRARVTELGDRILGDVGGYVSGAFVVAMAAGISTLVFLFVVGLAEYAVALALVVALLDVIPLIGATLGAVIVCAIGFATDVRTGIICVIFYVVYQQVENYLIYPRVMGRAVEVSGAVIVIAALVGAGLLGVIGALLAVPTAAAIQLLLRELVIKRQDAH